MTKQAKTSEKQEAIKKQVKDKQKASKKQIKNEQEASKTQAKHKQNASKTQALKRKANVSQDKTAREHRAIETTNMVWHSGYDSSPTRKEW